MFIKIKMSLNNKLFLLFLNSFIFLVILTQVKTNEKDCSEIERQNIELLLKIEDLENRIKELELENEELRGQKKRRRRKKEGRRRTYKKRNKIISKFR